MGLLCVFASRLDAQPVIHHDDVGCVPRDQFTQFLARIVPPEEIRAVKLYFRSALYSEFYFVEMAASEGGFEAVLPIPTDETRRIVYYIEAVDDTFQTARSEELEVVVEPGCRPGPGGLFFPGSDPGIVVGATTAGVQALPAGFQAVGVTGFLSAAGGAAAASGAGVSAGLTVGVAAGAAAGVGVLVANGGEETTEPPPTPNVPAPSHPPVSSPGPTTTPPPEEPSPPPAPEPQTPEPPDPEPPTPEPPTPAPPPPTPAATACFNWEARGSCKVYFDSCSSPESTVRRYEWRMLGPPVAPPPDAPRFEFDFEGDPRCGGSKDFNRPVRLTVTDAEGRTDSIQKNVSVRPGTAFQATTSSWSFVTDLRAMPADGTVRGQILVNGTPLPETDNRSPVRLEIQVSGRAVTLEAVVTTPAPPGAVWEFDFSRSGGPVDGAFHVETGTPLAMDSSRIAFRLSGSAGERIRFRRERR